MTMQMFPELDLFLAIAQDTSDGNPFGALGSLAVVAAIVAAACATRWHHRLPMPRCLKPKLVKLQTLPIDPDNLPRDVVAFFQNKHASMADLGFSLVGDFQTKHGREPAYERYYYRPDLDVWVAIAIARFRIFHFIRVPSMRGIEFDSVFKDGTYLCTTSMRVPEEHAFKPPQIVYRSRPGLNATQLLEEHCRCIDEYAARNSTCTLHYPAEQIADVTIFYTQYQREYWISKGIVNPPPGYHATPIHRQPQPRVELNA